MFVNYGKEFRWDGNFKINEVASLLAVRLINLYKHQEISVDISGGGLNWDIRVRFIPTADYSKFKKIIATYKKVDYIRWARLMNQLSKQAV